jgi:hypothetical protein
MSRPEFFGLGGILGGILGSALGGGHGGVLGGGYWNRLKASNRGPNRLSTGRDRLRGMIRERSAPESGL